MLKRIYTLAMLILFASPLCAMNANQMQMSAIRSAMSELKRSWNSARIRIKMAQKASPALYTQLSPIFEKLIASDMFTTKLNESITNQLEAIVNNNMPFSSSSASFNLSDYFPNSTMHDFGKNLFSAMASKTYCLELGKKLAQKLQELMLVSTMVTSATNG